MLKLGNKKCFNNVLPNFPGNAQVILPCNIFDFVEIPVSLTIENIVGNIYTRKAVVIKPLLFIIS